MVSSMAPTIAVDSKTGQPVLSVGGAGGTRITSGILQGTNHFLLPFFLLPVFLLNRKWF